MTDHEGTADVRARYAASVMNTFGPPQLVLARGRGSQVWDAEGGQYLDLLGGIAVNSLGHAHPALVAAVTDQLSTLGHVSNFFATEPQVALAERLLGLVGLPRRRTGVLLQLRCRGQRGGVQAHPAYRSHAPGGHGGQLPRPHRGRPGADLQGRLPGALRAVARPRHLRAVRRRRRPWPPRSPTGPPRSSSSPVRARPAWSSRRRTSWPGRGRSPARTGPCSGWTRCSPGWAAPARGWPTTPRG